MFKVLAIIDAAALNGVHQNHSPAYRKPMKFSFLLIPAAIGLVALSACGGVTAEIPKKLLNPQIPALV
jgi:hypothetical protein